MKLKHYLLALITATVVSAEAQEKASKDLGSVTVVHSDLKGIGAEKGVMRRDPSDVIKVGDLFYN